VLLMVVHALALVVQSSTVPSTRMNQASSFLTWKVLLRDHGLLPLPTNLITFNVLHQALMELIHFQERIKNATVIPKMRKPMDTI